MKFQVHWQFTCAYPGTTPIASCPAVWESRPPSPDRSTV
jgi:hypothetical protein